MAYLCIFVLFLSAAAGAAEIETNSVHMANAPTWIKRNRVEKVIERIQTKLEWSIRRVEVFWYSDQRAFEAAHTLGPLALAVSRQKDNTIHLGPKINNAEFDAVFGHELVHIILYQKYKEAIPRWFEEGLANHLAKPGRVNYKWLVGRPFPPDVRQLSHPFAGTLERSRYHYVASQALAEMIAAQCDLTNLLRLSVGKSIEDYLGTYCEIRDLNAAFRSWVAKRAK